MRKKKTSGTDLPSTNSDPLREELDAIFSEYPDGAAIAYGFLTTETGSPFIQVSNGNNIWRVRRDAVDRHVDDISDRVELKWTKKNAPTEP